MTLTGEVACPLGCPANQPYAFDATTPAGLCVHAAAAALHVDPLNWSKNQHAAETTCPRCHETIRVKRQ